METKLKNLFDFQRFERNSRIEKYINEALERSCSLSDDDLSMVSAAGEAFADKEPQNKDINI